jgi:hypothetical protein
MDADRNDKIFLRVRLADKHRGFESVFLPICVNPVHLWLFFPWLDRPGMVATALSRPPAGSGAVMTKSKTLLVAFSRSRASIGPKEALYIFARTGPPVLQPATPLNPEKTH